MFIHKTHTKKDLLKLCKTFNININPSLSKREIIDMFPKLFDKVSYSDNEYNIKNKSDLINYLKTKSPIQRLNADDKKIIMLKCKSIIYYCTNNYNLSMSVYNNHNEILNDLIYIHKYGEIPSVRRACKLYNQDPKKINSVNPVIPEYIQKELSRNQVSCENIMYNLTIKRGKFIVSFE
jgi:hypothetical protein